jgi:hypothetical protein
MLNILITIVLLLLFGLLICSILYYNSPYYRRNTKKKIESLVTKNIQAVCLPSYNHNTIVKGISVRQLYPRLFKKKPSTTIYTLDVVTTSKEWQDIVHKERRVYREKLYDYYKLTQDE